jgi:hypothetical protein
MRTYSIGSAILAFAALIPVLSVLLLAAGCGNETTSPGNRTPSTSLAADPGTVDPSGVSTITCTASDPDGDDITYTWNAEDGIVSGSGSAVTWTSPLIEGTYQIWVTVDDGEGHSASDTTEVEVRGGTLLMESRGGLIAVGMDASSFVLYSARAEVEVLGTRIFKGPNNATEIDHSGNIIGGPGQPPEVTRVTGFMMLPDGGVAYAENGTDSVFFVSPTGAFIEAVQLPEASSINQVMSGIVVGNDLIISETGSHKLARIDLTTHEVSIFKDLTQLSSWLGDIEYLDGMYYLTQWESLHEFTETGEPTEIAHFDVGSILGVAVVGTSAFVTSRNEDRIYRVDIPTGAVEIFAEGFNEPYEIEYLPVGLAAP